MSSLPLPLPTPSFVPQLPLHHPPLSSHSDPNSKKKRIVTTRSEPPFCHETAPVLLPRSNAIARTEPTQTYPKVTQSNPTLAAQKTAVPQNNNKEKHRINKKKVFRLQQHHNFEEQHCQPTATLYSCCLLAPFFHTAFDFDGSDDFEAKPPNLVLLCSPHRPASVHKAMHQPISVYQPIKIPKLVNHY